MTDQRPEPDHPPDHAALEELVAQSDTGARHPSGAAGRIASAFAAAVGMIRRMLPRSTAHLAMRCKYLAGSTEVIASQLDEGGGSLPIVWMEKHVD